MSISDHLPQFIITKNGTGDKPTNKTAKKHIETIKILTLTPLK